MSEITWEQYRNIQIQLVLNSEVTLEEDLLLQTCRHVDITKDPSKTPCPKK